MTDLVVSIVHHETPELLRRCLAGLREEGSPISKTVVVVDNASRPALTPEDLSEYPGAVLVSNRVNNGFGSANNQVFAGWRAKAWLVTNPDVRVAPGSLAPLLERLHARPRLGILGARMTYPDGRPQASCRRFPTLGGVLLRGLLSEEKASRFATVRRYLMEGEVPSEPARVDWLLGSCLLIKDEALRELKGFDEGFFMYYEDVDLCCRAAQLGWEVEYRPDFSWIHDYRRQSARRGQWALRATHLLSALRFLAKHRSSRGLAASL